MKKKTLITTLALAGISAFVFGIFGCTHNQPPDEPKPHTHEYAGWQTDDEYHWHTCMWSECPEPIQDKARHDTFGTGGQCSVCKKSVEHSAHSLTHISAQSSTCTESGNIEYWECKVCGLKFADAQGTTTVDRIIVAAGHDYITVRENEVESTSCQVDGGYDEVVKCKTCGAEQSRRFVYTGTADHGYEYKYDILYHWLTTTCGHIIPQVNELHDSTGADGACSVCGLSNFVFERNSDDTYMLKTVRKVMSADGAVVIPSEHNGKPVAAIGSDVLYNIGESVKSVVVPSSVKRIAAGAFKSGTKLQSITIPFIGDKIKTAADSYQYPLGHIFDTGSGADSTQQVYIGANSDSHGTYYKIPKTLRSVTVTGGSILDGAFYGCDFITDITLGDGVKGIGLSAFTKCDNLNYIEYGGGLYIGNSVNPHYALIKIKDVTATEFELHPDTKCISDDAFSGAFGLFNSDFDCEKLNLTEYGGGLYLGDGVNKNAILVVAANTDITSVKIAEGTRFIYSSAFMGCDRLTSITVPDSVESIGALAFSGCSALESLALGAKTERLGEKPFYIYEQNGFDPCAALTNITVAAGNTAFTVKNGCLIETGNKTIVTGSKNGVVPMDGSVEHIGIYAFMGIGTMKNIVIPDSVKSIGFRAFFGCDTVDTISIGSGLEMPSDGYPGFAYKFPYSAKSVTVSEDNVAYCSADNAVYSKDKTALLYVPKSLAGEFRILDGTVRVGDSMANTFADCNLLTAVYVPKSVEQLYGSAFSGAQNIVVYCENAEPGLHWQATWANSIVWDYKNNSTDANGYEITTIDGIRYKLKDGNATVMHQIASLTAAVVPSSVSYSGENYTVTTIEKGAFEYCKALTSLTVPFIGESAQINENSVFGFILGAAEYYYKGDDAPDSLMSVTVTDATVVPDNAFSGCGYIKSITLNENVSAVGKNAFSNCSAITNINLLKAISIGNGAFRNCTLLANVNMPKMKNIGDNAFSYCSSLASIDLSAAESIGEWAFNGCYRLGSVTIPIGVTSIGQYAFNSLVYCEAASIPSGWNANWLYDGSVIWDCNNNDKDNYGYSYYMNAPDGFKYRLYGDGACVYGVDWNMTDAVIPRAVEYEGRIYNVTQIADRAFANHTALKSVTLHNGITSVGSYAFSGCPNLQFNEYEHGLYLGSANNPYMLLYGVDDNKIAEFVAHSDAEMINSVALYHCYELEKITASAEFVRNAYHAALRDVVITGGEIKSDTFYGCENLSTVTICKDVSRVTEDAFDKFSGITIYCEVSEDYANENWDFNWAHKNTVIYAETNA